MQLYHCPAYLAFLLSAKHSVSYVSIKVLALYIASTFIEFMYI